MDLTSSAVMGRRFQMHVYLMVMSACAGGAAARSPITLDVLRSKGYGAVELILGQNRVYVPAEINGKKIQLLLDTGWGSEGITLGVNPSEFGIAPEKGVSVSLSASGARTAMGHGTAKSVAIGNVQIQGTPIYFGRINASGVLGHGFLKRNNAIIDLTNGWLYLRPAGKGRRVDLNAALTGLGMSRVPFVDASHGSYVINVEVNGHPAQMALDTGAQVTMVDARFAKQVSTSNWGRQNLHMIDAAGVKSASDFAGTKSFKIGGIPIRTPTVSVTKFVGYDATHGKMVGLLGLDVIGMNWGIIDVAQQKFYFVPAN